MLQVFHLDAAKVDLVLHMLPWDPLDVAACSSHWGAAEWALTVNCVCAWEVEGVRTVPACTIRATWARETEQARETGCRHESPDASNPLKMLYILLLEEKPFIIFSYNKIGKIYQLDNKYYKSLRKLS
jgi:hypothetical protein